MRTAALLIPVTVLGVTLAACGGGSSSPSTSGGATSSSPAPTTSSADGPPWVTTDCAVGDPVGSDTTDLPAASGATGINVAAAGTAPLIAVAAGLPPVGDLVKVDLVEGTGSPVQPGAAVEVNYCGIGQTTRELFDSSYIRGETAKFGLNQVISGWTDGLPGMKPGGIRLLVIPADMAYGDNPRPGSGILPGETLIFTVQLIASSK